MACSDSSKDSKKPKALDANTFARPVAGLWVSSCLPGASGQGTDRYEIDIAADGEIRIARYSFTSDRCLGVVSNLRYRAGRVLRLNAASRSKDFNIEVSLNPPHSDLDILSGKLRVRVTEDGMRVAPVLLLQQIQNMVLSRDWHGLMGPSFYFTKVSSS